MILKGSASLLGILAAFVVFVLLVEFVSAPSNSPTGIAATVIATLSIFLGIPVSIAIANDYFKRAGVVRRQLLSSEVLVCEGTVDDIVAPSKGLKNIRREVGSGSDVVLELLVPSGLVWSVNGRHSMFWTIAPTGRTAETADLARFAAQFVRPIETNNGTFLIHQRLLSNEECRELRGYLPRIRVKAALLLTLINALAGLMVLAVLTHAYSSRPLSMRLSDGLLVTFVLWCDLQLVSTLRARWRMQRDLRERFVVIYQPDSAVDGGHGSVIEFLPYSGAEWTAGGRAAAWRRAYGTLTGS
jgi:hypothetical protein